MSFFNSLFNALRISGDGDRHPSQPPSSSTSSNEFKQAYHCFPVAVCDKFYLEEGDKILLPPSAFEDLVNKTISYPMMFRLNNPRNDKKLHCGVMEFSADEGCAYIPYWMMEQLEIEDGADVIVTNVTLPRGSFVQFQPDKYTFAQLSNPRAVLEKSLRNYATLSKGSVLRVPYLDEVFHLEVTDLKPADAVTIIETDMQVDFCEPKNIKEYEELMEKERRKKALAAQFASAPTPVTPITPVTPATTSFSNSAFTGTSSPGMLASASPVGSVHTPKLGALSLGGDGSLTTNDDNIFNLDEDSGRNIFSRTSKGYSLKGPSTSSSSSSSSSSAASSLPPRWGAGSGSSLGGGQRLGTGPSRPISAVPASGGYSLSGRATGPSTGQTLGGSSGQSVGATPTPNTVGGGGLIKEVSGNWIFYKTPEGRLVRREPVSKAPSALTQGSGYSLKK